MYIYLSERKRRMFLCLSLPQNLSPKKLSPKDLRFLQKYVGNITVPLSLPLIKQQKKLYEKHINFPLKTLLYMAIKQQVILEPAENCVVTKSFILDATQLPFYASLWQKCKKYQSINYSQSYKRLSQKQKGLFAEGLQGINNTYQENGSSFSLYGYNQNPKCVTAMLTQGVALGNKTLPLQVENKNNKLKRIPFIKATKRVGAKERKTFRGITVSPEKIDFCFQKKNTQSSLQGQYNEKPYKQYPLSQPFLYNALCIYTQTVKKKQKGWAITGYGNPYYNKASNDTFFENKSIIQNFLHNPQKVSFILQKFASPPIFVNGQNQYWFCRFLYNKEHILLSISPQLVQNQKKYQKVGKSKYAHEKKKIALFYGQIAKKDIYTLSKNAQTLPGGFEENMYTLLESRIDVCLHRAGFSKTIAMARQLIRQGLVFVNGKKVFSCKVLGKPGDIVVLHPKSLAANINFCYKHTTKLLYNIHVLHTFPALSNSNYKAYNKKHQAAIKQTPKQKSKQQILRDLWRKRYLYSTHSLEGQYNMLDKKQQNTTTTVSEKQKGYGYLYPGFFLYTCLCKKTCPLFLRGYIPWQENKNKSSTFIGLSFDPLEISIKNIDISIFLNTYIASLLKSKCKTRNSFQVLKKKVSIFTPIMKNIQNANCASFWGQKPLNLEISHKMASYIYLYPPQKIISPICIDFNALKF